LLYEEGFTISGARSRLESRLESTISKVVEPAPTVLTADINSEKTDINMAVIRQELQAILTFLSA
jgi:hypothetical protein